MVPANHDAEVLRQIPLCQQQAPIHAEVFFLVQQGSGIAIGGP